MRSENKLANGSLLKEKALEFANELNIEGIQASEGWLKNEKKCIQIWQSFSFKTFIYFSSANKSNRQELSFPIHHQRLRLF